MTANCSSRSGSWCRTPRVLASGAVLVTTSLALLSCGAPGGETSSSGPATSVEDEITAPVTPEQVAELGDVTLTVWADQAEQPLLEQVIPAYQEEYPNVTVEPSYRSFDDLIATVVNAAASSSPPDVFQGNIGYAVDGALVEAGLVRPLDDVASAYGWDEAPWESSLGPARWNADASAFGDGTLYGVSPVTEIQGIYYNQAKLDQLGLEPPTSLEELATDLQVAQDAGEQPIMLGNADQYPATHILSDLAAADGDPADIRAWIGGQEDATFVTDGNREAAQTMEEWAQAGYFGQGYDGVSNEDAIARFANGEGVFFVGGSWNGASLGEGFGISALPQGGSGAIASPWHVSASTDEVPAAAAFLGMLTTQESAQQILDGGRLPVVTEGVAGATELEQQTLDALEETVADEGQVGYYDWTTTDMLDVMGGSLQEVMAGRTGVDDFLETVQSDWADARAER